MYRPAPANAAQRRSFWLTHGKTDLLGQIAFPGRSAGKGYLALIWLFIYKNCHESVPANMIRRDTSNLSEAPYNATKMHESCTEWLSAVHRL